MGPGLVGSDLNMHVGHVGIPEGRPFRTDGDILHVKPLEDFTVLLDRHMGLVGTGLDDNPGIPAHPALVRFRDRNLDRLAIDRDLCYNS